LIDNAIKYTKKGYIKIGYLYHKKGICFYVEDTGIGINREKVKLIFNKFEKINDFVRGVGIGLALCREIVNRAGGWIDVESEEGKGSLFRVWLPCKPVIIKRKKTL
jgi:signal transduction histidine kinase